MQPTEFAAAFASLPLAELHLHLEGSIAPATVVELARRHGESLSVAEVAERYRTSTFKAFLEAFKWVFSFLRTPDDWGLIADHLAGQLLEQNVVYAEVTVAVSGMLRRKQDVEANFAAIRAAGDRAAANGLRLQWIFDGAWQFGPAGAAEVVRVAANLRKEGVVAFGMGGDELALPYAEFRKTYEAAARAGLRCVAHAGEVGAPEKVRDAVELLGAERIGHGIAAWRDPETMELLTERRVALEICPTSNLRTGALAAQLGRPTATLDAHPLRAFMERGVPVTLGSDDPAMFGTSIRQEYDVALRCGLSPAQAISLAEAGFRHAFLPPAAKQSLLDAFRARAQALGLL